MLRVWVCGWHPPVRQLKTPKLDGLMWQSLQSAAPCGHEVIGKYGWVKLAWFQEVSLALWQ
jgi:hypothetical protein